MGLFRYLLAIPSLSLAELSSWQSFVQTFLLFIFLRFNRFLSHFLSNISHKIVAVALFPVARSRYFRCFICLCKFNVSSDHFTIAWSLFLSLRVFLSRQSCFYLAKFKKNGNAPMNSEHTPHPCNVTYVRRRHIRTTTTALKLMMTRMRGKKYATKHK